MFRIALGVIAGCLLVCSVQAAEAPAAAGSEKSAASPAAQELRPEIAAEQDNWRLFRADSFAAGVAASSLPDDLDVLWRFEVPEGAFESTAAIADKTVFIGDMDGELHALDLETGKPKWKYETESGFIAAAAYHTAEAEDGVSRVLIGDYDGVLHCVNASDGKKLWSFESDAEISASVNFYEGNVLFGSQDGTLYCLNTLDGKLIWKHTLQDQIRCAPTVVNGRCFVAGCDQQLHVIDIETGNSIASVPINAPTGVTPAVQGDLAFFGTEAGEVFAINWRQTQVAWTYADPRSSQPIRSCPAVKGDTLVIGGRSKKLYALDTMTGERKWMFPTRNRIDSSPVIVQDRVFVGSSDGRLYSVDLKSGKKLWDYEAGSGFIGSPAIADERLVIANDSGVVYCFGKKD